MHPKLSQLNVLDAKSIIQETDFNNNSIRGKKIDRNLDPGYSKLFDHIIPAPANEYSTISSPSVLLLTAIDAVSEEPTYSLPDKNRKPPVVPKGLNPNVAMQSASQRSPPADASQTAVAHTAFAARFQDELGVHIIII